MSEQKTPRQLIRMALLDAISADADWSQRHIEQRDADLERIGDELLAALEARAEAGVTDAMVERAAKAMCDDAAQFGGSIAPWHTSSEAERDSWRNSARTVLTAAHPRGPQT